MRFMCDAEEMWLGLFPSGTCAAQNVRATYNLSGILHTDELPNIPYVGRCFQNLSSIEPCLKARSLR